MGLQANNPDGGDEDGILSEINITPLTDIFLVLLIIFMVTSSVMSQSGVEVELPKATGGMTQSQPEGVILSLLTEGRMKVNDRSIDSGDYAGLKAALLDAFSKSRSKLVILEGDRRAFLGSVVEIMDRAREAGATQFAIATQPETRK